MWSISAVKERAKTVLYGNYWSVFLVCLLVSITGGGSSGNNSRYTFRDGEFSLYNPVTRRVIFIVIGMMVLRLIIGYIIEAGSRRYLLNLCKGQNDIGLIGFGFSEGRYGNIFKTMFFKGVLVFLWSLLLIIPGIVMGYAYRFVPYLLAENPRMKWSRALELSKNMTEGHKWQMFVFDLSFIGWYLLGALAFGLGVLFVHPYHETALTEIYNELKLTAVTDGLTSYDELTENREFILD